MPATMPPNRDEPDPQIVSPDEYFLPQITSLTGERTVINTGPKSRG